MRKAYSGFLVLVFAVSLAVPAEGFAAQAAVRLAPLGASYAPPSLGRKQGWLTITNRDWKPYTVSVMRKGRMSIVEGDLPHGTVIRSGNSVTIAVEKDTWDLIGSSGEKLECRVREGRTSTISLEPFGFVNNSGLRGVSNDGERVRTEVLFEAYAPPPAPIVVQRPPVIVQQPPVVVHQPPVVVQRPPVVVHAPPPVVVVPPHRRPTHRPPAHRPGHGRDGWGFTFGFNSR